jgi:hypothetical protein
MLKHIDPGVEGAEWEPGRVLGFAQRGAMERPHGLRRSPEQKPIISMKVCDIEAFQVDEIEQGWQDENPS